jgi:hypothetical protein
MSDQSERSRKIQVYGWLLFVVCSLFFVADAIVNGGPLAIIASVLFFLGCFVFVVALRQG